MASIGPFAVTVFRGYMPRARRRFRIRSDGGVDGDAVLFGGYSTGTVEIITRVLVPEGSANALMEQYRAQQEAYLSVIDQFGDSYANTLVVDINPRRELVIGGNAHVVGVWLLLPPSTPPAGAPG